MGKTYTDFSQLSKGMFKKSDPVVEIKPIPKKSAGGDDALAYFGLNAPQPPSGASGARVGNDASSALEALVKAAEAQIVSIGAERDAAKRKTADLEHQLAEEQAARQAAETERDRLRGELLRLQNELEKAQTASSVGDEELGMGNGEPVQEIRVVGLLVHPKQKRCLRERCVNTSSPRLLMHKKRPASRCARGGRGFSRMCLRRTSRQENWSVGAVNCVRS